MTPSVFVGCTLLVTAWGAAAWAVPASPRSHQAMETIAALLTGQWQGKAWVELEPPRRDELDVSVVVRPKADGTALLLDVSYSVKQPTAAGPAALHDEMAVLHFNAKTQTYGFEVFFSSGSHESGSGRLDGAVLQILSSPGRGGLRRLTLDRSHADEWWEKGEIATDGSHWRTYYDSRLRRVTP